MYKQSNGEIIEISEEILHSSDLSDYGTYILEVYAKYPEVDGELNFMLLAQCEIHHVDKIENGILADISNLGNAQFWQYNYQMKKGSEVADYGEYTVGGVTANMLHTKWKVQETGIQIIPQYSQSYYAELAKLGYKLQFDYYFTIDENRTETTRAVTVLGETSSTSKKINTWHTATIDFATIYECYASLCASSTSNAGVKLQRNLLTVYNGFYKDEDNKTVVYDNFNIYITGMRAILDSDITYTLSYDLDEKYYSEVDVGHTIDLTFGVAKLNGLLLNAYEYNFVCLDENMATIENGVLTVKELGPISIRVSYKLANGLVVSVDVRLMLKQNDEDVDGTGKDDLGNEFIIA